MLLGRIGLPNNPSRLYDEKLHTCLNTTPTNQLKPLSPFKYVGGWFGREVEGWGVALSSSEKKSWSKLRMRVIYLRAIYLYILLRCAP